jgi:hypothetical protein
MALEKSLGVYGDTLLCSSLSPLSPPTIPAIPPSHHPTIPLNSRLSTHGE